MNSVLLPSARPLLFLFANAALCAAQQPVAVAEYGSPHEREFDFWVGEWDVLNRDLTAAGGWRDAGRSVARIRPILGGKAILEEWDGKTGAHRGVFGISIRSYDPIKQRWVIVLNWPSPARFSHMEGVFRHGRGEFFPPSAFDAPVQRAGRFTFSDGMADSCRWDFAEPVGENAWRTNWVMEFSRRKSAAQTEADGEPIHEPPADPVCKAAQARKFDGLIGTWNGTGWRASGAERADAKAQLRVTSSNRGCATLCFLDVTDAAGGEDSGFEAWSYYEKNGKWVARTIDDRVPQFFVMVGEFTDAATGAFVRTDPGSDLLRQTRRVRYDGIAKDGFRCRHDVSDDRGETWTTVLDLRFERG